MTTNFQQTDTASVCAIGAYGTGLSLSNANFAVQAQLGGTPGVTPQLIRLIASATNQIGFMCEIPATSLAGLSWLSGNWTVRLDVSTANANLQWNSAYVIQISSACATILQLGANTTIGTPLNTTGPFSATVNCAAVNTPGATDKVVVLYTFDNLSALLQSAQLIPDVLIDSPFAPTIPTEEPDRFMAFGPIPAPQLVSLWG